MLSRRQFVQRNGLIGATLASGVLATTSALAQPSGSGSAQQDNTQKKAAKKKRPPRLDLDLVQEMVSVSHGNLDRVKELVEQEPRLVNACHDWSAGDFETALGAASHTGEREIALFLLENGARMDIFAATMLGRLDIVKATLTAYPDMINTKGPHGIPLIKHAEYGKEPAAEVLAYLKSFES